MLPSDESRLLTAPYHIRTHSAYVIVLHLIRCSVTSSVLSVLDLTGNYSNLLKTKGRLLYLRDLFRTAL
jgi:hypothetical protein